MGRVPRKRQRLPSSLLIENAPAPHHPADPKSHPLGPRHFRSRLATYRQVSMRIVSESPTMQELSAFGLRYAVSEDVS